MNQRTIRIIGVPMDLGQNRRGVDMGPSAARYAGLQARLERLGYTVFDEGNVAVPNPEEEVAEGGAKRLKAVTAVCQQIFTIASECVRQGDFTIFLGGDHSISLGTIAAAAQHEPVGLIWIDAHADFNTPETSPSGNIHGMPVAALIGDGDEALVNIGYPGRKLQPSHIVQIGIRDLDAGERQRLLPSGINVFTMRHVDELGMAAVARQALDRLRHIPRLHVSLDMDSLDPDEAAGVGTPVPGGLSYREAHLLMEILGDSGRVQSLDIVEINPILDDRNKTAELAVELAASLLGQRIL
ncbi:MAG: arginase [Ardenticatenaceae bacterium]|nr:arginase [Anaerolineales bacterium]MCB8985578.1 arginase [Ardenticatenaceae bacterium]MCB8987319.1 arginase [Ardenticatenaceae bacterium]